MSIEAMKQALEALEYDNPSGRSATINKLRQAIAEVEKQEGWVLREVYFSEGEPISHREPQPVAWANKKGQFKVHKEADEIFKSTAMPFYSAPVPAHTDHPMRHWDRTCPACVYESNSESAMQQMVEENQRLGLYESPKREWVGLDHEQLRNTTLQFNQGALWAERYLKEKNT